MQSALDGINKSLDGTDFGKEMDASQGATLAEDSGKVNQEAFGKHVGGFGQFVGQLLAWGHGLGDSAIGSFGTAIAAGLSAVFLPKMLPAMLSGLKSVIGKFGGGGGGAAIAEGGEAVRSSCK